MNRLSILKYDLVSIALYIVLVSFGIINIYSSSFNGSSMSLFDLSSIVGKQVIFFFLSLVVFIFILFTRNKFFDNSASIVYFLSIILLLGLFVFGVERGGARSWYALGPISFQPSELAKFGTALFLSKFLSIIQTDLKRNRDILIVLIIIVVPIILTTIQPDPGSALIFLAFIFPVIREGLNLNYFYFGLYIISTLILTLIFNFLVSIAILTIIFLTYLIYLRNKKIKVSLLKYIFSFFILISSSFSTNYLFENVLEQRHRDRINLVLGKEIDTSGIGYNINQSKIALSNGGFFGTGFLEGTQTKGNFVPRQHTDFIFSTIGEEWGFIGTLITIVIFSFLIIRIITRADKQPNHFRRIYSYCFASLVFFHFFLNVGMSIGLIPSIGIPLPFISYGGSSLLIFSLMFFVYLNFDSSRLKES
ncbi:MAG: rod shape-determining protein RodA [Flavobacteriaceae bacterium]|nr:rod shape-determining protein RodA [Flavobacteriaceae bacterium]MBL6678426.1 rod shape-determining protein RodA [Flavobacteriaceae bacterium]